MVISPIGVLVNNKKQTAFAIKENSSKNNVAYLSNINCKQPSFSNIQAYHQVISFSGAGLKRGLFKDLAVNELHPLWDKLISRDSNLYKKKNELRSEFERDLTRIVHSNAYVRMRDKAQVWALPKQSTSSTRLTHVEQVSQVARSIARQLGLNEELVEAIAKGHDIGHTPFGHIGEVSVNSIIQSENLKNVFWNGAFFHEKNSLRFIDDFETKLSDKNFQNNLNLTYAVRDGIVSHCGEIDENGLIPRKEYIDLRKIQKDNRPQPFTWEGCVVKLSDKIAYIGKDIEDALENKALSTNKLDTLRKSINKDLGYNFKVINNTVIINHFISDLCANSTPEHGLKFSEKTFHLINKIKKFNYEEIYAPKAALQVPYCDLAIKQIYKTLDAFYSKDKTLKTLKNNEESKPELIKAFKFWLIKYSNANIQERKIRKLENKVIYDINDQNDYKMSILEFITSLTDRDAKKFYEEIIFFG